MKTLLLWILPAVIAILAVGCGDTVDSRERGSIVVICKPGDTVLLALWEPNAKPNAGPSIHDSITATNRYDGLVTGTWRMRAVRMDLIGGYRNWNFTLTAGQVDTADIYKGD